MIEQHPKGFQGLPPSDCRWMAIASGFAEVVPRTCCYKGIRCDPLDFYQIFIIQGERPDGRLKLMYAPITDSLLRGLQSREGECGYKTWRMLPPRKQDTFNFSVFNSSGPRPGDVVLFVGTLFSPNFTARCENQWAPNRIYCIWHPDCTMISVRLC